MVELIQSIGMVKMLFIYLGIALTEAAIIYYFTLSNRALLKQYNQKIVYQEDLDEILEEQKRTGIPLPKKSQCQSF